MNTCFITIVLFHGKANKDKLRKTIDAGPCSGCDGADANEDKGEEGRSEGRKKRYASELE